MDSKDTALEWGHLRPQGEDLPRRWKLLPKDWRLPGLALTAKVFTVKIVLLRLTLQRAGGCVRAPCPGSLQPGSRKPVKPRSNLPGRQHRPLRGASANVCGVRECAAARTGAARARGVRAVAGGHLGSSQGPTASPTGREALRLNARGTRGSPRVPGWRRARARSQRGGRQREALTQAGRWEGGSPSPLREGRPNLADAGVPLAGSAHQRGKRGVLRRDHPE